jgi:chromosome segregation ATPase
MIDNNVFNKVVNDILLQVKPIYLRKQIATEFLDLITRMQEEKPRPKKILANRVYADATLMSMTKAELIEHIRILEHNWSAAEETLANSVKNSEQIFYEQKEEIERLKEDLEQIALCNKGLQDGINEYQADNAEMRRRNAELQKQIKDLTLSLDLRQDDIHYLQCDKVELQKQVDELKEKIMNLKSAMTDRVAWKSYDSLLTTPDDVEEIFGDAYESEFNKFLEQTAKDTAKKYHDIMKREFMKSNNSNFYEFWCNFNNNVVKGFGVEVE